MTTQSTKQPTHRFYLINGDDEYACWTKIGAAWANRDGQGFSLQLNAIPTRGRIIMREIVASEKEVQS